MIMIVCGMLCLNACSNAGNQEKESYVSPQKTNTVIVEYDMLSRPTVLKKGLLWNKKIWQYQGAGFMETVSFHLEWLSENKICLSYDDKNDEFDEAYVIDLLNETALKK